MSRADDQKFGEYYEFVTQFVVIQYQKRNAYWRHKNTKSIQRSNKLNENENSRSGVYVRRRLEVNLCKSNNSAFSIN